MNNIQTLQPPKSVQELTSFLEDFRAKIYPLQEAWKELTEAEADCGLKCIEFVGKLNLNTSSLKTVQCSLFGDLNGSYATFPKSGITQNGNVFQTQLLDTHTKEKDYTLLPTPTKSDYKATFAQIEALNLYLGSGHQIRLMDILCQKGFTKSDRVKLFEMVMGFNPGHTELEVSEMP